MDVEGSGAFTSVQGLFRLLPAPPGAGSDEGATPQPALVVLRLRGHLRTNLTYINAVEAYAGRLAESGGALMLCGLQPETIAQFRAAGLTDEVTLIPQGDELDGSLTQAQELAAQWLAQAGNQSPQMADPEQDQPPSDDSS